MVMPLDKESPIQAVCGKAARTVLCGGRAMKRTSLPLPRFVAAGHGPFLADFVAEVRCWLPRTVIPSSDTICCGGGGR